MTIAVRRFEVGSADGAEIAHEFAGTMRRFGPLTVEIENRVR